LNKCSFYDWIESAELGLRYLKEKSENIYILGLSMGGLIALKLAAVHREIKKVIVIASPLYLRGENNLFVQATRIPIFRYLIKSVTKPEPRDERYRRIWRENPSYRGVPTRASYEFYRLMQNVRVSLKDVAQSIMLVYSRDDMDVHFGNLSLMISLIGSKDIYVHIEKNMGHLITLEEKNEEVFEKIYNFIQR
ncbi:MAG: alpha/beta hydrolase, partial [Myxococcota bacterium]